MATKKSDASVLPRPADVDPDWAEKIAKARETRQKGQGRRSEKPFGFYVPHSICRSK